MFLLWIRKYNEQSNNIGMPYYIDGKKASGDNYTIIHFSSFLATKPFEIAIVSIITMF